MKDKINKFKYILLVLVCFLLIFSAVQAFQINDIKESIEEGMGFAASSPRSTQQAPVRQQAPSMVGGC